MRVAVVSMETTHHRDTDATRRIERVAGLLSDAGHDVTIFCAQWWDGYRETIHEDGITYRGVTVTPTTPSFVTRLPALLARQQPDVVHAAPTPPEIVLAAGAGAKLGRAPLVVEWFDDGAVPETRTGRLAIRRPELIVTPSELVRTRVRERGAMDDQTTVIPESIDMDLVRETEPREAVDVVYANRLDESANVESLFLGLAELRQKDWSATIVGDGPQREAYERQAADLRIDDRVTFAGACDRAERIGIYRGAHVFVQTAYRVNFATELLWALSCGCVGIVEYQAESSAHELIERRERSFRVTDPEELADRIVESADLERRTVDESFAEFDHENVRGTYEDHYERLIGERGLL
ncbi:MAG: glycosyltransferase family 4 protein [Haloarculaceae archaeon]